MRGSLHVSEPVVLRNKSGNNLNKFDAQIPCDFVPALDPNAQLRWSLSFLSCDQAVKLYWDPSVRAGHHISEFSASDLLRRYLQTCGLGH